MCPPCPAVPCEVTVPASSWMSSNMARALALVGKGAGARDCRERTMMCAVCEVDVCRVRSYSAWQQTSLLSLGDTSLRCVGSNAQQPLHICASHLSVLCRRTRTSPPTRNFQNMVQKPDRGK